MRLHPTVAVYMQRSIPGILKKLKLMIRYLVRIKIEPDPTLSVEEFKVMSAKTGKDLMEEIAV